jgi:hypothetical protein
MPRYREIKLQVDNNMVLRQLQKQYNLTKKIAVLLHEKGNFTDIRDEWNQIMSGTEVILENNSTNF